MEKKMEHDIETGFARILRVGVFRFQGLRLRAQGLGLFGDVLGSGRE